MHRYFNPTCKTLVKAGSIRIPETPSMVGKRQLENFDRLFSVQIYVEWSLRVSVRLFLRAFKIQNRSVVNVFFRFRRFCIEKILIIYFKRKYLIRQQLSHWIGTTLGKVEVICEISDNLFWLFCLKCTRSDILTLILSPGHLKEFRYCSSWDWLIILAYLLPCKTLIQAKSRVCCNYNQ